MVVSRKLIRKRMGRPLAEALGIASNWMACREWLYTMYDSTPSQEPLS